MSKLRLVSPRIDDVLAINDAVWHLWDHSVPDLYRYGLCGVALFGSDRDIITIESPEGKFVYAFLLCDKCAQAEQREQRGEEARKDVGAEYENTENTIEKWGLFS